MTTTTTPPAPPAPAVQTRVFRDPDGMLGGVASGLAHHTGIDVGLMRFLFVATCLVVGVGPLVYLAAWILLPESPVPLHQQGKPDTASESQEHSKSSPQESGPRVN